MSSQIPGKLDRTLYIGTTFLLRCVYRDNANAIIDVTGYKAWFQMRADFDTDTVALEAKSNDGDTPFTFSGTSNPNITLNLTPAKTVGLKRGKYKYGVLIKVPTVNYSHLLMSGEIEVVDNPVQGLIDW